MAETKNTCSGRNKHTNIKYIDHLFVAIALVLEAKNTS